MFFYISMNFTYNLYHNSIVFQDQRAVMALTVVSTHLYILENAIKHHTNHFELIQDESTAIFRRGQMFDMRIQFNRSLEKSEDIVRIILSTGERL